MADTGAPHSLPYPVAADPPAGHTQMQALAIQVAARLGERVYSEVLTSQTTGSAGPLDLATVGPSATITVPANGLVAVRAEATIGSTSGDAIVTLVEDGVAVTEILRYTGAVPVAISTVPGSLVGATSRWLAGWLVFPASAGSHTYKLQYGRTAGTGTFLNRKLWVTTIPF